MIPFVGLTAVEGLVFSEHYHAAHIFLVVPIAKLADVHRGFRKALLMAVALPGYLVLYLLYSVLWENPWHALLLLSPWMMITPVAMMTPMNIAHTSHRPRSPLARRRAPSGVVKPVPTMPALHTGWSRDMSQPVRPRLRTFDLG